MPDKKGRLFASDAVHFERFPLHAGRKALLRIR
jgi:hypothetical protein